jgi:uncharacterized DUF497 family protein
VAYYEFQWDAEKARLNQRKHGVSFAEATTCFFDPFAFESFDVDHSNDEDRFMIIGMSQRNRVLVVAFTLRDDAIRLVSAREALRKECVQYEDQASGR